MNRYLFFTLLAFVFISSLLSYPLINLKAIQSFTFIVYDEYGKPLKDVYIQGVIPLPPDKGSQWEILFLGKTDSRGEYIEGDLTRVRIVMNEWIRYLGDDASYSYPNIVVFLTYNSTDGLYVEQASIDLNPVEIVNGKSYSLIKTMHIKRRADASNHPRIMKMERFNNFLSGSRGSKIGLESYLPPSKPYQWPSLIWVMINSYTWPSTGYGRIPISWIESSSVFGSLSAMIYTTSSMKFNIGFAIESTGTTFKAGATLWSTTKHFAKSYELPEQGDTGYIYIEGKIEAAKYQLAEIDQNGEIIYYYDTYQDDVAIVDLHTDGSEILGGIADGLPPQINYINQEFSYEYYTAKEGTGNTDSSYAYHLHSDDFVDTYAASDHEWIDFATVAGSILLYASGGGAVAGIATNILLHLVASISSSSLQVSYVDIDYDSYSNYDMHVYVKVGSTTYVMSNGEDGRIPLMGIKILGYPQYPGAPH